MRLHCTKQGSTSEAHLHLIWVQLALQKVRLGLYISLQHLGKTVPLGAALLKGSLIGCGSCRAERVLSGVATSCSTVSRTEYCTLYMMWQVTLTQLLKSPRPPHACQTSLPMLTALKGSTSVQKLPHSSAQELQTFKSWPEPTPSCQRPAYQMHCPAVPLPPADCH